MFSLGLRIQKTGAPRAVARLARECQSPRAYVRSESEDCVQEPNRWPDGLLTTVQGTSIVMAIAVNSTKLLSLLIPMDKISAISSVHYVY